MQTNYTSLATPAASSNAKAIGLFNKISGGRQTGFVGSANSQLHTPQVVLNPGLSRGNDRNVATDTHFPDFFQNVKHVKPQKKRHSNTSRSAPLKWSGNNDPQAIGQQPVRQSASATRRQTTIVDKSKMAVKLDTWRDVKNSSSDQSKLLQLKASIPDRPSTAGQPTTQVSSFTMSSNNREGSATCTDTKLSNIKGYVRTTHDKFNSSTTSDTQKNSTSIVAQSRQSVQEERTLNVSKPDQSPINQMNGALDQKQNLRQVGPSKPDKEAENSNDNPDICFGETPDIPGVPVVYRSQKAKSNNPERLNLDRRALKVIPLLEGEHMLRLLNLQNNIITCIDNLHGLPNLIFLDLYNNKIEKIDNLQVVPNLRVLMLGKNKLKTIENLDCLPKLDVLDLHSNEIDKIDRLEKLVELRVLNLAGNRITVLENISNLTLLTELNLRRNQIESISTTLGRLPTLQRLFISNNKLPTKESLQPLFQLVALTELRLDGNKFNEVESPEYRSLMIQNFVSLRNLDLKAVTEEERREAFSLSQKANDKKREQQREENQEAQRVRAITAVRKKWEEKFDMDVTNEMDDPWSTSAANADKQMSLKRLLASSASSGPNHPTQIQIGFSEVEVSEEARTLFVYGDALEALESPKIHNIVTTIVFKYIPFDVIVKAITQGSAPFLQNFVSLKRIHFANNQLATLEQLAVLSGLGSRAEELIISHNPVCHMRLLRPFVSHVLKNVQVLNGQPLSLENQLMGEHFFDIGISTGSDKSDRLKKPPTLSRGSTLSDRTTNALIHKYLTEANRVDAQLKYMNDKWHAMVYDVIKETLEEVEDMDKYMSKCLERL